MIRTANIIANYAIENKPKVMAHETSWALIMNFRKPADNMSVSKALKYRYFEIEKVIRARADAVRALRDELDQPRYPGLVSINIDSEMRVVVQFRHTRSRKH